MPGGTICSVALCKSNAKKAKELGLQIKFFNFPSDSATRREWVRKCQRKDKFDPKNKRICSLHFKTDDYEDELQSRLLNIPPKKLRKDAIPSLSLPSTLVIETAGCSQRTARTLEKERRELVKALLDKHNSEEEIEIPQQDNISTPEVSEVYINKTKDEEIESLKQQLQAVENENRSLKTLIKILKILKKI